MTDRQWRIYQQHIPKPWWQRQWNIYQQHIQKPWWQIDNDKYINRLWNMLLIYVSLSICHRGFGICCWYMCHCLSVIVALEYIVDIRVIVYLSSWLWNMLLIYVSLSLSSWLWNMLLIYVSLSICHHGFGICCWYMLAMMTDRQGRIYQQHIPKPWWQIDNEAYINNIFQSHDDR
jgi:hypothetical protein